MTMKPFLKKIVIGLAWGLWGFILWLALIVIVNAVPPDVPPGQQDNFSMGTLPPGLAKQVPVLPTPTPDPSASPTPALTGFGALLGGVTPQEKADWLAGRVQFQVIETPSTGLGPEFNGQSCQQCHGQPVNNGVETVGGPAANTEVHFSSPTFGFDLFHLSSLTPPAQDAIPADTTVIAVRKSNTTAGLGLIEAIPDATIIGNAQQGADGVFGRPAILSDPVTVAIGTNRVGRFGWKAQESTVTAFAADGLINELGLTNRFFGTDIAPHVPNGVAILTAAEPPGITPTTLQDLPLNPALPEDDETNSDRVARLAAFLRFNAPNPTLPLSDSALKGQTLFTKIGCVRCHTPSYQTGANSSAALSFQNVALYSDLRLHVMGQLADGIVQGNAQANETRTAPLWGLRARSPFLHDGRASTVLEAIQLHDSPGAESQQIAQRFEHLPDKQQQQILDFLESI
jgi:CxxC motif-containing protein (DUF1111 family)